MNQCILIGEHGTCPLDTHHSLLKPTGYRTQANNSTALERDGPFTLQELRFTSPHSDSVCFPMA